MVSVSLWTGNSSCNKMTQTYANDLLRNDEKESTVNYWCNTDMKVLNINFTWFINKYFGNTMMKPGKVIESSTFKSHYDKDVLEWCLQAYPHGNNNKNKDCLGIFLKLVSATKFLGPILVKANISILNVQQNKSNERYFEYKYKKPNSSGIRRFIKRSILFSEANELVPGDKLTILCELSLFVSVSNTKEHAEIFRFITPNCRLIQDFGNILKDKKYTDVILVVGDKEIHAHKAILSARSPVFAAMFKYEMLEKKSNKVEIIDLDADVLLEMLRYMYTGVTTKLHEMAEMLLPAADKYALNRLKVLCEESLYNNLSEERAAYTLKLADMHSAQELKIETIKYINTKCDPMICTMLKSRFESLWMMEETDRVTESWCNTEVLVDKINVTWMIKNFSLCMNKSKTIHTTGFASPNNHNIIWNINARYGKKIAEREGYLQLFIFSSPLREKLWARFSFTLLNAKRQKIMSSLHFGVYRFYNCNDSPGSYKDIRRETLLQNIPDDKLIIFLEITIVKSINDTSGIKIFKIPECTLREELKDVFIFEMFSDVTFVVENKEINAHKAILSARSPVFAKMFDAEVKENANKKIEITHSEFEVFNAMLRYIYTGETPELNEMADRLLPEAVKYGLKHLKLLCEESLYYSLSEERAAAILILADMYSAPQLKTQAISFINTNDLLIGIIGTVPWSIMLRSCPYLIDEILMSNRKLS